jgi:hypothetical protein
VKAEHLYTVWTPCIWTLLKSLVFPRSGEQSKTTETSSGWSAWALKTEAACSSETLLPIFTYQSTRRKNRKYQHRHLQRRENLKKSNSTILTADVISLWDISENNIKVVLREQDVKVWTAFVCPRTGSIGGLMWTRQWIFELHKLFLISLPASCCSPRNKKAAPWIELIGEQRLVKCLLYGLSCASQLNKWQFSTAVSSDGSAQLFQVIVQHSCFKWQLSTAVSNPNKFRCVTAVLIFCFVTLRWIFHMIGLYLPPESFLLWISREHQISYSPEDSISKRSPRGSASDALMRDVWTQSDGMTANSASQEVGKRAAI